MQNFIFSNFFQSALIWLILTHFEKILGLGFIHFFHNGDDTPSYGDKNVVSYCCLTTLLELHKNVMQNPHGAYDCRMVILRLPCAFDDICNFANHGQESSLVTYVRSEVRCCKA